MARGRGTKAMTKGTNKVRSVAKTTHLGKVGNGNTRVTYNTLGNI